MFLPSYLMRTHGSKHQQDAVKGVPPKQMQNVYEVITIIEETLWMFNLLLGVTC